MQDSTFGLPPLPSGCRASSCCESPALTCMGQPAGLPAAQQWLQNLPQQQAKASASCITQVLSELTHIK